MVFNQNSSGVVLSLSLYDTSFFFSGGSSNLTGDAEILLLYKPACKKP
jgi:hypothetical protein